VSGHSRGGGLQVLHEALEGVQTADEESLAYALRGLTRAEAEWQPPGYPKISDLPLPPPGTEWTCEIDETIIFTCPLWFRFGTCPGTCTAG
jgi:hypothetical protein